jgi:Tol biopolymer transport system component
LFNTVFCGSWSPDGTRLACGAGTDTRLTSGVYTIRSSDGGGLKKVVSCDVISPGAECGPNDYSPDGKQLLLEGLDQNDETELFVVKINGSGFRQLTPTGTLFEGNGGGSWSPSGDKILFGANADTDHRRAIFVVNADGTDLHKFPIPGCGGAFSDPQSIGCFAPSWSPDGTKIVFTRASAMASVLNIYTANANGRGLFQVTHESSGLEVTAADWGTHPLAH